MHIRDLITVERVACDASAASKKRALEAASELLGKGVPQIAPGGIFTGLIERERLGSTGLGQGVAIPHARMKGCNQAVGAFIKLAKPVDFDASDRQQVDLLFALLVPEHFTDEHLQILAMLASLFSDKLLCQQLRGASSSDRIYQLLAETPV